MAREQTVQKFIRLTSRAAGGANGRPLAPPELRPRLVGTVEERDSTLTAVVVGILAERYGVPFEPTGRRTAPVAEDSPVHVQIPMGLYQKISARAAANAWSVQKQIIADLCGHYGLEPVASPPSLSRARPRAATA